MVSALITPEQAIRVRALARVYKWVPAHLMLGVTLHYLPKGVAIHQTINASRSC